MKKIRFFKIWDDIGYKMFSYENDTFKVLLVLFCIIVFIPYLCLVLPVAILSILQELIILIFTISKELIQLLKLAVSRLFKLGDTK